PLLLPQRRRAISHAGLDRLEVTDLALVAADRLELQLHRVCNVENESRLLPLHQVHLTHLVRLVVGQQLRKGEMVARQRVDTIEDHTGSGSGVPMPGGRRGVRAGGVERGDKVWWPPAKLRAEGHP